MRWRADLPDDGTASETGFDGSACVMPELTEDSPEVVLVAASRGFSARAMLVYWDDTSRDRGERLLEAARKLAAEGKLGPVEQWQQTSNWRAGSAMVMVMLPDGPMMAPVAEREWRRGNESEWRGESLEGVEETWEPTHTLRWVNGEHWGPERVPQQLWRSSLGREEWRDVPVEGGG
ncbi:MAG: hypothetical protein KGL35_10605 [Bradyrhizobium sp.]|nr:hypothetical protein [Bradyrhizobium sp.]